MSELELLADDSTNYVNDDFKSVDTNSVKNLIESKYNPYVVGGSDNIEYQYLLDECPYESTPGLLSIQMLINKYLINKSIPLPDNQSLYSIFRSSYHLKNVLFSLYFINR